MKEVNLDCGTESPYTNWRFYAYLHSKWINCWDFNQSHNMICDSEISKTSMNVQQDSW